MVKRKISMNVSIDYNLYSDILEAIRSNKGDYRNRSHFVENAIREKIRNSKKIIL